MNRTKIDAVQDLLKLPTSGMLEIVKTCCPLEFGLTGYREANGWVDKIGKCYAEHGHDGRDLRYCVGCWCERLNAAEKPQVCHANVDNLVERLRKEADHEAVSG